MSSRIDPAASTTTPGATALIVDARPLSLLATAGVLHHEGLRCVCARTVDAVKIALGLVPSNDTTDAIDLLVWNVGDDPALVLQTLETIRSTPRYHNLPALLVASADWAGLEKKTQLLAAVTHCLFEPIDPRSLAAIATQLAWVPALQTIHRAKGSRPSRPGWVTLEN